AGSAPPPVGVWSGDRAIVPTPPSRSLRFLPAEGRARIPPRERRQGPTPEPPPRGHAPFAGNARGPLPRECPSARPRGHAPSGGPAPPPAGRRATARPPVRGGPPGPAAAGAGGLARPGVGPGLPAPPPPAPPAAPPGGESPAAPAAWVMSRPAARR